MNLKVLITLRFYAMGSVCISVADMFGVSVYLPQAEQLKTWLILLWG